MIKITVKFKSYNPGEMIKAATDLEEWLVSRGYAEPVIEVLPPLQTPQPAKPLTTRKQKKG